MGQLKETIRIDPPDQKSAIWRATDVDFTRDRAQTHMFVMDLGSGKVRILERKTGREVGGFGRAGPMAGEFRFAHTLRRGLEGQRLRGRNGGRAPGAEIQQGPVESERPQRSERPIQQPNGTVHGRSPCRTPTSLVPSVPNSSFLMRDFSARLRLLLMSAGHPTGQEG